MTPAFCGHLGQARTRKDIKMKNFSLLIAGTAIVATLGLGAPLAAQTANKVMLTDVDPATLTTAWRATDIIGASIYDDNGVEIGTISDMLVQENGSIPFVIVTTLGTNRTEGRTVVVSATDFERVGKRLTMHGGSADMLLNAPQF